MKNKVVAMAAALVLVLGMTSGVASAKHKSCEEQRVSCAKRKCILKQRKECVCFYLKKADELGLSEEQVAKLKKLQRVAKTIKIRNKAEVEIIKLEIHALLDEKKPDLSAIDAKIDKCSQLKAAVKKACFRASVKAREVLTEEQFKQAKKLGRNCDLSADKPCIHKGEGHHSKKH